MKTKTQKKPSLPNTDAELRCLIGATVTATYVERDGVPVIRFRAANGAGVSVRAYAHHDGTDFGHLEIVRA